MRPLALLFALTAVAAGCTTRNNPDVCCVSATDCARLGVDEPRPCGPGQACRDFGCVAAECATAADCVAPDAPVCADNLCVAACRTDADCAGAPSGPLCAPDGACVGCLADAQCPASAPFCDAEDRACRGCEADAECASGVCLELDARCAAESEVVFVSTLGQDTGECTRSAPCRSLEYALTKVFSPTRLVVHIAGGNLMISDLTLALPVYLDGTATTLNGDGSGPYVQVAAAQGPVTLGNVLIAPGVGPAVTVAGSSFLRIYDAAITNGIETMGGTVNAKRSTFGGLGLRCTAGTLSVDECRLTTSIDATSCQVSVSASMFEISLGSALSTSGGRVSLENNLFIQATETDDSVQVVNVAPGSVVRFNTIVNTSTVVADGVALYCDSTLAVSSNIFAYNSTQPHGTSNCASKYSLYETVVQSGQSSGIGNRLADRSAIFINLSARDFYLAPASPARAAGEPGSSVTRDLEGHVRPNPAGSAPDMGAFEAP